MSEFTTYLDMGEVGEHEVNVAYDYRAGWRGSFNEPPEYPEAEITSVKWLGIEILDHLPKPTIDRLVEQAFDDVTAEAEQAMEDRAEAMAEMREAA